MSSAQDIRFSPCSIIPKELCGCLLGLYSPFNNCCRYLTISFVAVARFSLYRGKRPSPFPAFPDMTDNSEAAIETSFRSLIGSCPRAGLCLTLLSSEISPNRCLFGSEAWWTISRSSGLSFDVDSDYLFSSFPYLCFDFACGRHT